MADNAMADNALAGNAMADTAIDPLQRLSAVNRLSLIGILLLGAALRLWTIAAGAPYVTGVDEPEIVDRVVRMLRTGDFHPHFFDYPGVTFYLHLVLGAARFLSGAMAREWASLDQLWSGDLLVWGRAFTALLSTATIALVFAIGRRWSVATGLVAALATAVQPQLVQNAHFVLTDTPLTFFVTAAVLAALRAGEIGTTKAFAIAGLLTGLAAATKYNGAVVVLAPLAIALLAPRVASRTAAAVAVLAGSAAGFVIGAPYSVIDLPGFLNGFAALVQHYNQSRPALETADTYRKYIQDWFGLPLVPTGWRRALAWPALILCGLGAIAAVSDLRAPAFRARALALLVFPIAYFWLIANQSLVYARYAMPIAPALSIALALGVRAAARRAHARAPEGRLGRVALPVLLLVLVAPLWTAVGYNLDRRKVGTIELAAAWLSANIPNGELVVLETGAMRLPPRRFPSEIALKLIDAPLDQYRERGVSYLVANSMEYDKYFADPARFGREMAAYNELFRMLEPVQTFTPSADHPGPAIRVLRIVK
jgi:4-amino-4-deoxy-L-arabinose transferase-like glycosyltransferase